MTATKVQTDNINSDINIENVYRYDEQVQVEKMPRPKKDRAFRFLLAQCVLSACAIIISLILKGVGGYYYDYARAVFIDCFDTPINIKQVLDAKDTKAVIAAQATVYGVGGESDNENVSRAQSMDELNDTDRRVLGSVNTMAMPTNSNTITCEFGYRIHPLTKDRSFHTGIDIGQDYGEDIYSALDGKVLKTVFDDEGYGDYIIISHSSGVQTMYAHCSKICVKPGQTVLAGEKIAECGSSGMSTGPHLHFEVRVNNVRINPRWLINF